jgi:hypothetical protein
VNVVLDGLKPEVVWHFVNDYIMRDVSVCNEESYLASVAMVDSLTEKMLELNSPDSQTKHLPSLVRTLVSACKVRQSADDVSDSTKFVQLRLFSFRSRRRSFASEAICQGCYLPWH